MILSVLQKRHKNTILAEMHAFDSMLQFTVEEMTENGLNFLDTTVTFEHNQLNLRQYRK